LDCAGKKTAAAIHREIAREMNNLLARIFSERRKTGGFDLESIEMAVRSGMHDAAAEALTKLLEFPAPPEEQRTLPCPCGRQARYRELRPKKILSVVGEVIVQRPYYLCPHCHQGQFPADAELDVENTEFSPGVRRMHALVGQQAPFEQGREQMNMLAGLEVTTKAVERVAEAIGEDLVGICRWPATRA
jgi:hypothetical protein